MSDENKMSPEDAAAEAERIIASGSETIQSWVKDNSKKASDWVKENKTIIGAVSAVAIVGVAVAAALVKNKN